MILRRHGTNIHQALGLLQFMLDHGGPPVFGYSGYLVDILQNLLDPFTENRSCSMRELPLSYGLCLFPIHWHLFRIFFICDTCSRAVGCESTGGGT